MVIPSEPTPSNILDEFQADLKIQPHLGNMALDCSKFFEKYERVRTEYNFKAKNAEDKLKVLKKNKWLWIAGKLSKEEFKALGWPPFEMKLLKNQYDKFIDSDPDVIALGQVLYYNQEMSRLCDSIIWQLKNREKSIQKDIDYERFLAGN